jgi:hypothetical protein
MFWQDDRNNGLDGDMLRIEGVRVWGVVWCGVGIAHMGSLSRTPTPVNPLALLPSVLPPSGSTVDNPTGSVVETEDDAVVVDTSD